MWSAPLPTCSPTLFVLGVVALAVVVPVINVGRQGVEQLHQAQARSPPSDRRAAIGQPYRS